MAEVGAEKRLGEYILVREIGRGAMSTVYEGVDTRAGRTVAVKLLAPPPTLTPHQQNDLIARLKREARAIARLSHPNIVSIYDVGEQDGHHFLVMEYLDGMTLRACLDRGPLSVREASRVLDQVGDALDTVHGQGVVHRDIKPSNVMLLPDGGVKLLDFGVARQGDDTTLTQTGAIVGSPAYMSPEQVRGEPSTPASDLWALGALLYEMLAGHPPFTGPTIATVLYQVTHDKPAPVPGISTQIQNILRRALEKSPTRRYRSGREMADALRRAFSVPARRPDRRWTRAYGYWALPLLAILVGALFVARHPGVRKQPLTSERVFPQQHALPASPSPAAPKPLSSSVQIIERRPATMAKRPAPPPARVKPPAKRHPAPRSKPTHHTSARPSARRPARAHRRRTRSRILRFHAAAPRRRGDSFNQKQWQKLDRFIWKGSDL